MVAACACLLSPLYFPSLLSHTLSHFLPSGFCVFSTERCVPLMRDGVAIMVHIMVENGNWKIISIGVCACLTAWWLAMAWRGAALMAMTAVLNSQTCWQQHYYYWLFQRLRAGIQWLVPFFQWWWHGICALFSQFSLSGEERGGEREKGLLISFTLCGIFSSCAHI